ncbi:hypothetical protein [Streptomyces boncukensis]|uniref:Uncharacterized protein n=1 Tax=Streptomyces boncukensis TaxID=2711219 RepID=A0A6G4X7A0_9ACTN|nr:hypothetical protein [Streptomyces boncukensis]NGO73419.1 hypothetical protein [Streptomyces boncukensis]
MIDAVETGSGPGAILYACPPCARTYALSPLAPDWLREDSQLDGWRIDRVPAKSVRLEAEGHIAVPLWLLRDNQHLADLDLTLSPSEAETLHAQLGRALEEGTRGARPA